ncbi:MAG: GSCFA domain-containing protein, partial [Bacteroidota bacterium]
GDQLIYHENFWYSPYHHGKFYHEDKNELLQIINTSASVSREKLLKSDVLIITFGTSMAWRHISTNSIYANCHKLPSAQFKREFISTENIIEEWTPLINNLHKTNPDLKIIFSVSPVRYVRQGIVENNISKASLITAVHELCKLKNVSYFPAYEIINDVLRDYRFFKEDMVHPNEQAIKIIWETFTEAYLNKEAKKILTEIEKLNKLISHRSEKKVTQHKSKIMEMINELMKKYPEMSWDNLNTR